MFTTPPQDTTASTTHGDATTNPTAITGNGTADGRSRA